VDWLLAAAPHQGTAGSEWSQYGVAVLTAGVAWDAVRVPYEALDRSFAHDTTPVALRTRLAALHVRSAVFCDPRRPWVYLLVLPGSDAHWPRDLTSAGVECLGGSRPCVHHIGVPCVDRVAPPGPYWLCLPDRVDRQCAEPAALYEVLRTSVHDRGRSGTGAPQVIT
jgi:hypothetical protein